MTSVGPLGSYPPSGGDGAPCPGFKPLGNVGTDSRQPHKYYQDHTPFSGLFQGGIRPKPLKRAFQLPGTIHGIHQRDCSGLLVDLVLIQGLLDLASWFDHQRNASSEDVRVACDNVGEFYLVVEWPYHLLPVLSNDCDIFVVAWPQRL